MSLTLVQKAQALINYIELNPQEIYTKNKAKYDALAELRALTVTEPNEDKYRKALDHLVRNYFSTEHPSPLMYAAKNNLIDLMEDILALPSTKVDEQFNHKVGGQERNVIFGIWEKAKVKGPEYGYTALVYAARAKNNKAINILLRHYANPNEPIFDEIGKKVLDLVDQESDQYPLLEYANFQQEDYLVQDLAACNSELELERLIEIQKRLGIPKEKVIEALINHDAHDEKKQIALLEQATDFDEFNNPQNPLAHYVKRHQTSGFTDDESMRIVGEKLANLLSPKEEVKEPVQEQSSAVKELVLNMLNYGPQGPQKLWERHQILHSDTHWNKLL